MNGALRLACGLVLAALLASWPGAASAQALVNEAARFDSHPLLLDTALFAGFDSAMTPAQTGGFGARVGLSAGVTPSTQLGGWASYAFGGSECDDGRADPSDPFLGCYADSETALGVQVRQGLISLGRTRLGLELGAGLHSVPASSLVLGLNQHGQLNAGLVVGRALLVLQGGAAFDETPRKSELEREAYGVAGIELEAARLRPSLDLRVSRLWSTFSDLDGTQALLTLGMGYELN